MVPEESTRPVGSPDIAWAATVSTSQGLVTSTNTASGARSRSVGISFSSSATFVAARSSRVWPGSCFAPAVTTTTWAPSSDGGVGAALRPRWLR